MGPDSAKVVCTDTKVGTQFYEGAGCDEAKKKDAPNAAAQALADGVTYGKCQKFAQTYFIIEGNVKKAGGDGDGGKDGDGKDKDGEEATTGAKSVAASLMATALAVAVT